MESNKLWDGILESIKSEISPKAFNTWFKGTGIKSLNDSELVIYTENEFAADWVRINYSQMIQKSSATILNREVSITITSKQGKETENTISSLL